MCLIRGIEGEHMEDTGISQEIAALREQMAATEAEIARLKSETSAKDTDLAPLVEALDSMTIRLSRLESCKRMPDA